MPAAVEAAARRVPRRRARDDSQRTNPLTARFSDPETADLKNAAKARGITVAHLIANATMAAVHGTSTPPPARTTFDDLIDELAAARTQVAKVGTNLNQIAHRINARDHLRPGDLPTLHAVHRTLTVTRQAIAEIDAAADLATRRTRR